ncbi:hypothetical protein V7S43_009425 [Phytophthora oleae]|uniref:Uncharacterized protein n=1 Tax=Phytophthora oleae TaxID=2107226 RepID=A0ABD3FEL4_9STRA
MSVQSLSSVTDAKITPASASFKAAAVATQGDPQHASWFDCIFATMAAKTWGDHGRVQLQLEMDKTLPLTKQIQDEKLVVEAAGDTKVEEQKPQQSPEGPDASNASASETEHARTNWLELRARVENANPRVFAYHDDPKYLQQCEDAKQRRALAAAMSISPSWY